MSTEEASCRHDQVSGYGKLSAAPVLAAKTRDERAEEEERGSVGAQSVNGTDPAVSP